MSLGGLPAELLHRICRQCSTTDVANFRSVCSQFAVVGAGYLLPDLELYMMKDRFSAAQKALTNPRIAKSVRTLCLHADLFPHYDTFNYWNDVREYDRTCPGYYSLPEDYPSTEETVDMTDIDCGERLLQRELTKACALGESSTAARRLVQAYQQYKALSASQDALWHHDSIRQRLRGIFVACPRLDRIILTVYGALYPWPFRTLSHFRKAMVYPGDSLLHRENCLNQHIIEYVLLAALEAGQPLKHLEMASVPHDFFRLATNHLVAIGEAVRRLEVVDIEIHDTYLKGPRGNTDQGEPDEEEFDSM